MKFVIFFVHKTAFHIAVEKGDVEMIKLLLNSERIDANLKSISILIYIHAIISVCKFNYILFFCLLHHYT